MKSKVALMLAYLVFSTVCMVFACMMQTHIALKTIVVLWLTASMLIFTMVFKFMRYDGFQNKEIIDSYTASGELEATDDGQEYSFSTLFARYDLTKREIEILEQICHGKTNIQIAETLYISESTVKTHVSNTYKKLGVKNRTEAICMVNDCINNGIPIY